MKLNAEEWESCNEAIWKKQLDVKRDYMFEVIFFFNNETWSLGCDVQSCDAFEDCFYSLVLITISKCNPHGNAEVTNYDCLVSPWNARSPLNYRIRGLGFAGTSQRAPQYVW